MGSSCGIAQSPISTSLRGLLFSACIGRFVQYLNPPNVLLLSYYTCLWSSVFFYVALSICRSVENLLAERRHYRQLVAMNSPYAHGRPRCCTICRDVTPSAPSAHHPCRATTTRYGSIMAFIVPLVCAGATMIFSSLKKRDRPVEESAPGDISPAPVPSKQSVLVPLVCAVMTLYSHLTKQNRPDKAAPNTQGEIPSENQDLGALSQLVQVVGTGFMQWLAAAPIPEPKGIRVIHKERDPIAAMGVVDPNEHMEKLCRDITVMASNHPDLNASNLKEKMESDPRLRQTLREIKMAIDAAPGGHISPSLKKLMDVYRTLGDESPVSETRPESESNEKSESNEELREETPPGEKILEELQKTGENVKQGSD